jgi:hypothetical protein
VKPATRGNKIYGIIGHHEDKEMKNLRDYIGKKWLIISGINFLLRN